MIFIPSYVPAEFVSMYLPTIYAALFVVFIGAMKKNSYSYFNLLKWSYYDYYFFCYSTDFAETLILLSS